MYYWQPCGATTLPQTVASDFSLHRKHLVVCLFCEVRNITQPWLYNKFNSSLENDSETKQNKIKKRYEHECVYMCGCTHKPSILTMSSKSTRKYSHSRSKEDEVPSLCYKHLSSLQTKTQKQAPCGKADFSGRASKAQDESGTIYSARKVMGAWSRGMAASLKMFPWLNWGHLK